MTANGYIYTTMVQGVKYYFLASQKRLVRNFKEISIGDIYWKNPLVKMKLGNPAKPDPDSWPEMEFIKQDFSITGEL